MIGKIREHNCKNAMNCLTHVAPNHEKDPASPPGLMSGWRLSAAGQAQMQGLMDQKSMPPMPPPGMAGAGASFFGASAIIASVVMSRPATEAAS